MRAGIIFLGLVLNFRALAITGALTVCPGDWGEATVPEIHLLLQSAQRNFYGAFSSPPSVPVVVQRGEGPPQLGYRLTAKDPARIYLNVRGRYWSQFTYQFAHELCHLACDYDRFLMDDHQPHPWMWFQETLCETASLFTLRRMAENWKRKPPYPAWKQYAPHLRDYAQKLLDDPQRQLPATMRLADWYATHRFLLATNATVRPLNAMVAHRLLPLFEVHPRAWQAVRYLPATHAGTLTEYLQAWLRLTPRKYSPIIRAIAREFQVTL